MLNPVIALTITDFEMFPDLDTIISSFILKEREFLIDYPIYDIELVFAELPKFKKELHQLETIADKWLYFLKTARSLQEIPEIMGAVPEIKQAFEIANRSSLNREELEDLDHREIYIYDQRNIIKKALNQGIQQGIEQGLEQGLQQGLQQGKTEAKIEIAKQMLDQFDDSTIRQITQLSLEEIQSLRTENQSQLK